MRACAICNKPANFSCGGCKVVSYCGKDHQRQDWKDSHKSICKPSFRVEKNEKLGRYLVAARKISKGELIFQEPALVTGPKVVTTPICLGCHAICGSTGRECDGCGYPLCSVQCQVADNHFDECQIMMKNKFRAKVDLEGPNVYLYSPIVPLRILILKDKQPEKYKKIISLESHLQHRKDTPLYNVYKQNLVGFLQKRLGFEAADEDTILHIAGVLDTNSFDVRQKDRKLRGLYGTASMMAHDCKANTRHTFHGNESIIAVSATVDIAEGEAITATYSQTFEGTIARRQQLRQSKCFSCDCKRCSDPTELGTYLGAFRCSQCATKDNYVDGPKMVSTDPLNDDAPWHCPVCLHKVAAKFVKSGNENLKQEISRLDKSNPEVLEAFLEKYGVESIGILHPSNSFVVQVKHALIQIYGNRPGQLYGDLPTSTLEKKIDYCHELLEVIEKLDPGYSRIRGQILSELQAAMVMQSKRLFGDGKITRQAAQDNLAESMVILAEVIEIMKNEPDAEDLRKRLEILSKELDE